MAPRAAPQHDLLRFLTCGSVDDGKSTLIGRMLYDAGKIHDDQMEALKRDSARVGTTGGDLDLALLVDGLEAEREQGITIDVAWRFFATARRSFIVADTPGHEQYTRNMATGASTCDLAVVLADARKGVLVQTRRHAFICSLMRVRHVVLAVNKMDLVGWDQALFDEIAADFAEFAGPLGFESVMAIPVSARFGDNVASRSQACAWWTGPTLMERLETVPIDAGSDDGPFRFPVEWINRPNADFRGYAGTVVSGRIRVGDEVAAATSGRRSRVARIVTYDGDLDEAAAGEAPTLTLADEIDVARGEILCRPEDRPVLADQFAAHLVWMAEEPLLPGRSYLMRIGTRWVPATVTSLRRRIDVNTLEPMAARRLELNEIGVCNLSTAQPVAFDAYAENRATGGFILVDRMTNQTLAAGTVDFALRRATNIHPEPHTIDRAARAAQKGQRPVLVWFTGLSGSGKSTIADIVERELNRAGCHTYLLDGDNVRHGLNRDLGFTDQDRVENIRRVGEVARLMTDAGLIALASFISPFEAERLMVRELFEAGDFVEVFVDTPIELCKARDPKGLYRRAEAGLIRNFTGVDSPYERPSAPELTLFTPDAPPEALAQRVVEFLKEHGVFG